MSTCSSTFPCHSTGDAAICHVTRLAARALRGYDALFRIGGEEFAVLVNGGTLLGIEQMVVSGQGAAGGQQHAVGIHPGFNQGTRLHVLLGRGKAVLQHGGDLLI